VTNTSYTGQRTYALRFASGEYASSPTNWMQTTTDIAAAHLWLRQFDESAEARAAWLVEVAKRMSFPVFGTVTAVRAR
jgi:hypothetical protein